MGRLAMAVIYVVAGAGAAVAGWHAGQALGRRWGWEKRYGR